MKYKLLKLICFVYFMSGASLFALGPVTTMTSDRVDSVEEDVSLAIAAFRQTCVGSSGQYSIMPEIVLDKVVVTTVTNTTSGVEFTGGTWTWGLGWTGANPSYLTFASGITIPSPADSDVVVGQAFVASIKLHVNLEDATACPAMPPACVSAATTLNTAITEAWSGILTIPNVTPEMICSARGPTELGVESATTYAPVPLPPAANVNVRGVRDYLWY